jgi:DNA-directed RNA polymerase subunit F
MSTPTISSETPISMAEVKEEIDKIKKRDKELSFRTQRTEEYLSFFVQKDSKKLLDAIKKLDVSRLKDEHIVKIADLMPRSVDDLKIILQGYTVTVTKDNMKKIIDEVAKFL